MRNADLPFKSCESTVTIPITIAVRIATIVHVHTEIKFFAGCASGIAAGKAEDVVGARRDPV